MRALPVGVALFGVYLGLMLLLAPSRLLFGEDPSRDLWRVLEAVGQRFSTGTPPAPQFLAIWLAFVLLAPLVPLRFTERPLQVASAANVVVALGSLVLRGQREHTWRMLRLEPAMGYMWMDTVKIAAIAAIAAPAAPLMLGGPAFALAAMPRAAPWRLAPAVAAALLMQLLVLPGVAALIDEEDGLLKFRGYSTASVLGDCWAVQLVWCWLRAAHLIARASRRVVLDAGLGGRTRALGFAWLWVGNVLVLNYVCLVVPLHYAVTHALCGAPCDGLE